jgi:hypothetical protein
MKITVTWQYVGLVLGLVIASIGSWALKMEPWITIAWVAFLIQTLGHEWTHVITAKLKGLEVTELHLDFGDGWLSFNNYHDGRESVVFRAGFIWDVICYSGMAFFLGTYDSYISQCVAIFMVILLVYSTTLPDSDFKNYWKTRRVI